MLSCSFLCFRYDVVLFIFLLSFPFLLLPSFPFLLSLIHFFARQRNESKKGDTGETLRNPFTRFSPLTPIHYDIGSFLFGEVLCTGGGCVG